MSGLSASNSGLVRRPNRTIARITAVVDILTMELPLVDACGHVPRNGLTHDSQSI
jgi:hypothetical protein